MEGVAPVARRLEGEVAIITGGASGIGACTAQLFAKHGAKVIIADVQDELGRSLCREACRLPGDISFVHCDVSYESDVMNVVDAAISRYGKLDVMFNNAGVVGGSDGSILSVNYEDFKRVFDVNVFGVLLGAKHAARVMIPARKGSILFTSSIASVVSGNVEYEYLASKHAVVGITKNLCVELGQYGIRANCISPGGVATAMLTKALGAVSAKEAEDAMCAIANLKEVVLKAEDIAAAALYLASDESKYVSGLNMVVDGGYSTTNPSPKFLLGKMQSKS